MSIYSDTFAVSRWLLLWHIECKILYDAINAVLMSYNIAIVSEELMTSSPCLHVTAAVVGQLSIQVIVKLFPCITLYVPSPLSSVAPVTTTVILGTPRAQNVS